MKRKYQKPTMEVIKMRSIRLFDGNSPGGTGSGSGNASAPRYDPVNDPEDLLNFQILTDN